MDSHTPPSENIGHGVLDQNERRTLVPREDIHRAALEKRIDDLKWFVGLFAGSIAFLFAALTAMLGLNLASEKSSIRDYKDELRREIAEVLGKTDRKPLLSLRTLDRRPLDGSVIEAEIWRDDEGDLRIKMGYVVENQGKASSGPMFLKTHSSDIPLPEQDIDGVGYRFMHVNTQEDFTPREIPGGVSMPFYGTLYPGKGFKFTEELQTVRLSLFYANGDNCAATVRLKLVRRK